jgi:hypothetical protein
MPSVTLIWNSQHDDKVCKICQLLDGKEWTFPSGTGVPHSLDYHGETVWDDISGSEAHGHKAGSCRCHLTFRTDLSDILQKTKMLLKEVEAAYGGAPE